MKLSRCLTVALAATMLLSSNVVSAADTKTQVSQFVLYKNVWTLDGQSQTMDGTPKMINQRVYLPIRYVAVALGIPQENIKWDRTTATVAINDNGKTVVLKKDSKQLKVDGQDITMDGEVVSLKDRIYLPLSQVAKAFSGVEVKWDATTKTVTTTRQVNETATTDNKTETQAPTGAVAGPEWVDKYVKYVANNKVQINSFDLRDINGDGVPEVAYYQSPEKRGILYINKAGEVKDTGMHPTIACYKNCIILSSFNGEKGTEVVLVYNPTTGDYDKKIDASYTDQNGYAENCKKGTINGVYYDEMTYTNQMEKQVAKIENISDVEHISERLNEQYINYFRYFNNADDLASKLNGFTTNSTEVYKTNFMWENYLKSNCISDNDVKTYTNAALKKYSMQAIKINEFYMTPDNKLKIKCDAIGLNKTFEVASNCKYILNENNGYFKLTDYKSMKISIDYNRSRYNQGCCPTDFTDIGIYIKDGKIISVYWNQLQ